MARPGAELIVSVRRDAVVPALVIGLGGGYAEVLDDVAIVPLPADPARVERASGSCKRRRPARHGRPARRRPPRLPPHANCTASS